MAHTAETERSIEEQASVLARRFHDEHEQLYARAKREEPRPWDEMPPSYHQRLLGTFTSLLRKGVMSPGPVIGWEHRDLSAV